ncbi:MAG: hypothetical protein WKF94_02330 [Solirubrobacteraceae bacterium]
MVLFDGTFTEAGAGSRAWLYVTAVERHRLPVCFIGDDGAIVRPQLPSEWLREPVHDATERCPACAGDAWEYIVALEGSRGLSSSNNGPLKNNGVVVCVRCGYEVSTGVFYAPFEDDTRTEQEQQEALERFQAERREREQAMLANLDISSSSVDHESLHLGRYVACVDRSSRAIAKGATETIKHVLRDAIEPQTLSTDLASLEAPDRRGPSLPPLASPRWPAIL